MEEVENQIKRSRLRQSGHVMRMDTHRIPKILLEIKISGRGAGADHARDG
jgi:hypothetical protein